MKRKIKWEYDEKTNVTVVRLGKKGCQYEGKPNPIDLTDAEFLLRQPVVRKALVK
jgi:hypothetical protein